MPPTVKDDSAMMEPHCNTCACFRVDKAGDRFCGICRQPCCHGPLLLKPGGKWPVWEPCSDPGRKKVQADEIRARLSKMKANADRLQAILARDELIEQQREAERDASPKRSVDV